MKSMLKKSLACILVATMCTGLLAGCGSGSKEAASTTAAAKETAAAQAKSSGETAASGEIPTLHVGLQSAANVVDYDTNYLTLLLEEKLGANIEFTLFSPTLNDAKTKISLMINGGETLPDVIMLTGNGSFTSAELLEYGTNGAIIPVDEYLYDEAKMPNFHSYVADDDKDVVYQGSTMSDGHIYSFCGNAASFWDRVQDRAYINTTWLDKLGLEVPTTTEELREVLMAFKTQDPNGNGIQDEIPVYGMSTANCYGRNVIAHLMNSFVSWNANRQNYGLGLKEDGKTVFAPYVTEEWKAGLAYMKGLYDDGLLPAEVFTVDDNQFKAVMNNADINLVGFVSNGSNSTWTDYSNNPNYLEMRMMAPVAGPNGVNYASTISATATNKCVITKDCKDVDLALKFVDLFYTDEIACTDFFGEEGVDFSRDFEAYPNAGNGFSVTGTLDFDPLVIELVNVRGQTEQNKLWSTQMQIWSMERRMAQLAYPEFDGSDWTKLGTATHYDLYKDHAYPYVMPVLSYNMDEAEAIRDAGITIPDYVYKSLAEFITGAKDLDKDWANYVNTLEKMGLQTLVDTVQASYDRMSQ